MLRSPLPDVEIPEATLPSFVLEHARDRGARPALIDAADGASLTYEDLEELVERVAAGLAGRGIGHRDVVGLWSANAPAYALAFLAVARAGAATTTLNALWTAEEAATQLRDSGARMLIAHPDLCVRALEAARLAGIHSVVALGDSEGATPLAAVLGHRADAPYPGIDPAVDLVSLPYSSGTTGVSKGVMLTHRNLVANLAQSLPLLPIGPDDVVAGILPFFHIYGQTVVLCAALRAGATIVTLPRFDLEGFLGMLQGHRVTRAFVVPPIVLALAKHPAVDGYDLSSLTWLMSGAAPLSADLADACEQRLEAEVTQGYGLTETSPVATLVPRGMHRAGSIGPLVPNTEGGIVDPEGGGEVDAGTPGELWLRGPQVMRGYLGNPGATAAALDAEGWLRTGDIVVADDDGWLVVVDRLKELIKCKGLQVAPAELEALLLTHPAVADACVVGVPDERAGEVPKAFVVLREEADPEAIMAFVAERVAPYKRLRQVEVLEAIPRSASGKILRRVLLERERAAGA
jgi:acyl-CoA synthetase (AMP-forming)/AMP-acid ligase II